MAITFSDQDLRTISESILNGPTTLSTLGLQQNAATGGQADALAKDNGNKVFFDNYSEIVYGYQWEDEALTGLQTTQYNNNDLDDGGQQKGAHFPTSPIWLNLNPKLLASNNGNPSTIVSDNEIDNSTLVNNTITLLKNGFTDGAVSDITFENYVPGNTLKVVNGGFGVGQRILINSGSVVLVGLITDVLVAAPLLGYAETLTFTVTIPASGSLPAGSTIQNSCPGFTNGQREGTLGNPFPGIFAGITAALDATVTYFNSNLLTQQSALLYNDGVTGAEATQNAVALANVQSALPVITAYVAAPATGAGIGQYGDTVLVTLTSLIATRASQIATRSVQITTALGSVSQDSAGIHSGSGHYFNLFKWIVLRIAKAGGSLTKYYGFNLITGFTSQSISSTTTQLNEFADHMKVTALSQDADGTNVIVVASVADFSPGNAVSIVDDSLLATLSTTISAINGTSVQLAAAVSGFLKSKTARMVKVI